MTSICEIIAEEVPMLQSLTIDYQQDKLSEDDVTDVRRMFEHLPRLVVNSWKKWSDESRFEDKYKTVVLDISN